ncbi:MAG: hypothetical protein M1822_003726 [Bathelium mastoideum]|nr:MAG: hypothetical protein M1822_003726 [Bathelium mastoideum]
MSNPLSSTTTSALNAQQSPPTAKKDTTDTASAAAQSPLAKPEGERHLGEFADLIDGPPSSPFVSELDLTISTSFAPRTPDKQDPAQTRASDALLYSPFDQPPTVQKQEASFRIHEDGSDSDRVSTENSSHEASSPAKQIVSEPDAQSISPQSEDSDRVQQGAEKTPEDRDGTGFRTPKSRDGSSPRKRASPVKTHSPIKATPLRFNEGLTVVTKSWTQHEVSNHTSTTTSIEGNEQGIDDTCFSAFSEVPSELTRNLQRSAKKGHIDPTATPRAHVSATPRTSRRTPRAGQSRSPSPTPRHQKTPMVDDGNTTSLLLDFTQQMESFSKASSRRPQKSSTESNLLTYINGQRSPTKVAATPSRGNNILNLLDFELPPAPTPRSVPTITVRELESLKSGYQSEISSLKATLSGREAEVESLKKAVSDAERRVGEAQEVMREERNAREHVEKEKREWENRGKEVESVLKNVKEEIMKSDKEKDELVRRLEEAERRAEEAETRAIEAKGKAGPSTGDVTEMMEENGGGTAATAEEVQRLVQVQLDQKIESVSRELHAVYKKKHETKVATLKKSYEARSEKKCAELQQKIDALSKQNEDLQIAKESTFSGTLPLVSEADRAAEQKKMEEQKTELEEQKAKLAGFTEEMKTLRSAHAELVRDLENERIEKGELVAAVDEMLALQSDAGASSVIDDFRKSISKPSGLKPPSGPSAVSGGESRIGRVAPSGLNRSTSGGKSRIMTNIERMGSGRAAN